MAGSREVELDAGDPVVALGGRERRLRIRRLSRRIRTHAVRIAMALVYSPCCSRRPCRRRHKPHGAQSRYGNLNRIAASGLADQRTATPRPIKAFSATNRCRSSERRGGAGDREHAVNGGARLHNPHRRVRPRDTKKSPQRATIEERHAAEVEIERYTPQSHQPASKVFGVGDVALAANHDTTINELYGDPWKFVSHGALRSSVVAAAAS